VRILKDSDATVRFGPVQRALCLNLGLDLWFGSEEFSNLGLDLEGTGSTGSVQVIFSSNLEPHTKCILIWRNIEKYYVPELFKGRHVIIEL